MCERECFCVILQNRVRGLQTRGKGEPQGAQSSFPGLKASPRFAGSGRRNGGGGQSLPLPRCLCSQGPQDGRGWPLLPSHVSLQLTGTEDNPEVWRVGTWHSGVVGARPGMVPPGAKPHICSPLSWLLPVRVSFLSVPQCLGAAFHLRIQREGESSTFPEATRVSWVKCIGPRERERKSKSWRE